MLGARATWALAGWGVLMLGGGGGGHCPCGLKAPSAHCPITQGKIAPGTCSFRLERAATTAGPCASNQPATAMAIESSQPRANMSRPSFEWGVN